MKKISVYVCLLFVMFFCCEQVYATSLRDVYNNSGNQEQLNSIEMVEIRPTDGSVEEVRNMLPVLAQCNNLSYIYYDYGGMSIDNTFFDYITSNRDVSISLQDVDIDLEGIDNTNITSIYFSHNYLTHFKDIKNLSGLKVLSLDSVDGFEITPLDGIESLSFKGMFCDDYSKLFDAIKNVKLLNLSDSNVYNNDMNYINKLTKLEEIQLAGTRVTDISGLKNNPNLRFLGLPYDIGDINKIKELSSINEVDFNSITETKVTNELISYLENNNINYPVNFDRNIKSKIDSIINSLNINDNMTDFEKIKKVTEYVHLNYEGSQDGLDSYCQNGNCNYTTSLDQIINSGYGVCHDYSVLGYTLLKLVGVDVYYVSGYAKFKDDDGRYAHAWNVVKIDGEYYGLDLLWSDDNLQGNLEDNYYYLKPTIVDSNVSWPDTGDDPEYIDKLFGLRHRSMVNPILDSNKTSSYSIDVQTNVNGSIEVVPSALENDIVTFRIIPKENYKLSTIKIITESGREISFTEEDLIVNEDGTISINKFTMPAENVRIEAVFSFELINPKTGFYIPYVEMILLLLISIACMVWSGKSIINFD